MEQGVCLLCGTKFCEHSEQHETLSSHQEMHKYHNWKYHSEINDLRYELGDLNGRIKASEGQLTEYIQINNQLDLEIAELEARIREILELIDEKGEGNASAYQRQIQELQRNIMNYRELIASNDHSSLVKTKEMEEIRKKIALLTELDKSQETIRQLRKLASENEVAYKAAYKKAKESLREKIAHDTREHFHKTLHNNDLTLFGIIEINEKFELITRDSESDLLESTLEQLSAGQFQMLLHSFIQATFNILEDDSLELNFPLIMDSGLNRLGHRNREKLLTLITGSNVQFIMFVTDSEYTYPQHHLLLSSGKLGKVYELRRNMINETDELFEIVDMGEPASYLPTQLVKLRQIDGEGDVAI